MFNLFGIISRLVSRARSTARSSAARANARRIARGKGSKRAAAVSEELIEEAIALLEEAEEIILDAYINALTTMSSMVGNPGQASVMEGTVIPAFEEAMGSSDPETGWQTVDIGEYMAFMGQIVSTGNEIMEEAFDTAAALIDEADEVLG